MRTAIIFVSLGVMAWVGLCSPVDRYYDSRGLYDLRSVVRRSSPAQDVKGRKTAPHHHNPQAVKPPPELNLSKGEYMCSGRVCKLRPGEVPEGCNGVCQYPV